MNSVWSIFEVLGWLIFQDSFLFNTRDNVDTLFNEQRLQIIILQMAVIGILPDVVGRTGLDAGCGTGRYTRILEARGAAAVARLLEGEQREHASAALQA